MVIYQSIKEFIYTLYLLLLAKVRGGQWLLNKYGVSDVLFYRDDAGIDRYKVILLEDLKFKKIKSNKDLLNIHLTIFNLLKPLHKFGCFGQYSNYHVLAWQSNVVWINVYAENKTDRLLKLESLYIESVKNYLHSLLDDNGTKRI